MEDKIYAKHNIFERESFESYVNQESKKNVRFQKILQNIRNCYNKSLSGKVLDIQIEFLEEITPEFLLNEKKRKIKFDIQYFIDFCNDYTFKFGVINPRDTLFGQMMDEKLSKVNEEY